jgi:hypothetical protein
MIYAEATRLKMSDDFRELLSQYLQIPSDPNPEMVDVEIIWIRDDPSVGSLHIQEKHKVTEREVEDVLLLIPPYAKARRPRDNPSRTAFWGATQKDRWLVVICEEKRHGRKRYLTPITTFEPNEGEVYWRSL